MLNTAGYRFNQTDLNNRDQYGFRIDYEMNPNHRFEGVYSYFKETDDRTDLDLVSPDRPLVYTSSDPKRFAARVALAGQLAVPERGARRRNLAPVQFESDWDYSGGDPLQHRADITNPSAATARRSGSMPQGRYTNTYQFNGNASTVMGSARTAVGRQLAAQPREPLQLRRPVSAGELRVQFRRADQRAVDLGDVPRWHQRDRPRQRQRMAAWLGGIVTSTQQTFQVEDASVRVRARHSVKRALHARQHRDVRAGQLALEAQLHVRAGLKWEYYSPIREDDNLGFLPVINGGSSQTMLNPATTITFTDGDYWNKDLNNFGPTVGFAWDLTRDGKTAVRGGYSLTFVNEESVTVGRSAARGNAGLTTTPVLSSQYKTVAGGCPADPATPTFLTTRTLANQMAAQRHGCSVGHRS